MTRIRVILKNVRITSQCGIRADKQSCVLLSHGLGDARVALGRLGGHAGGGNHSMHRLVQEHAAEKRERYRGETIQTAR